jgi:uncharacterized protein YndB with AHSA1/START domain
MAALKTTIEIARPPREVFAFATDPRRFPQWQRDVVEVRVLDGDRFTTTRRFARAERTLTQRITSNDPPYRWAAQGVDGPIRPSAVIAVEPIHDGTASRVTFTLDFDGHGLGVALLPLVRRQASRGAPISYRNLKHILEDERPAIPRADQDR